MSRQDPFDIDDVPDLPRKEKSSGMKTLSSCGCGCLVVLLLLAVAAVLLFQHFWGPGDQVPTENLLGSDAVFVVHMDAPSGDAGAKEFLSELFHTLTTLDTNGMDEETRENYKEIMSSTQELSFEDAGQLVDFMPNSMTLVVEDNGTELNSVFGLNMSAGPKLLRYLVTNASDGSEWEKHDWGEYELLEPKFSVDSNLKWNAELGEFVASGDLDMSESNPDAKSFGYIGFQHDTFVWSDDMETMKRALERTAYEDEPGPPEASDLSKDLETLRERWLVSSVLRDSPRLDLPTVAAEALTAMFAEEGQVQFVSAEDLEWMDTAFGHVNTGIGFVGDDLVLRIEVNGLDSADVQKVAKGLEAVLGRVAESLQGNELVLAHEVISGSSSIAVNANLEDLRTWLRDEFEDTASEMDAEYSNDIDLEPLPEPEFD